MSDSLGSELVHVACESCGNITSYSLDSVRDRPHVPCPYCGADIRINLERAKEDALREAEQLDHAEDGLGSLE